MQQDRSFLIGLHADPASDSWGFVGVVRIGEYEAYRTIRAYSSPREALRAGQRVLADVLGALMAGQEWRSAQEDLGHAPRRTELGIGLRTGRNRTEHAPS